MSKQNQFIKNRDDLFSRYVPLWEELRDQKIFITGGTGFFGCWLLESFLWANETLNLNASVMLLTRNAAHFQKKCPHLIRHNVHFLEGDVRTFAFPNEKFSHVIHAATDASAHLNDTNPQLMLDTIVQGTQRVFEFSKHCNVKNFLFISSGAVYGKQPPDVLHLPEDYPIDTFSNSAYALGKRIAEQLCYEYAHFGINIKIARCFAFLGPYLPLDIHFAIGNFILSGLTGQSIIVHGDGTPYRSYLYAGDLIIWLWTILICGKTLNPYNVGSDEAFTIAEIASMVANSFRPACEVKIMKTPNPMVLPERYVPDITKAQNELLLSKTTSLIDSINLTKLWYLSHPSFQKNNSKNT